MTTRIKLWARVLIAGVTLARRLTGATVGSRLVGFALAHGFVWSERPTVPEDQA